MTAEIERRALRIAEIAVRETYSICTYVEGFVPADHLR